MKDLPPGVEVTDEVAGYVRTAVSLGQEVSPETIRRTLDFYQGRVAELENCLRSIGMRIDRILDGAQ